MDDFIQNGLRWSVEHHFCQVYVVKDDDILVALFALSFDSLEIDAEDKMDIVEGRAGDMVLSEEYKEVFFSKTHYPALGLTYLAVSENFQRQGWGKWIVEVDGENGLLRLSSKRPGRRHLLDVSFLQSMR